MNVRAVRVGPCPSRLPCDWGRVAWGRCTQQQRSRPGAPQSGRGLASVRFGGAAPSRLVKAAPRPLPFSLHGHQTCLLAQGLLPAPEVAPSRGPDGLARGFRGSLALNSLTRARPPELIRAQSPQPDSRGPAPKGAGGAAPPAKVGALAGSPAQAAPGPRTGQQAPASCRPAPQGAGSEGRSMEAPGTPGCGAEARPRPGARPAQSRGASAWGPETYGLGPGDTARLPGRCGVGLPAGR